MTIREAYETYRPDLLRLLKAKTDEETSKDLLHDVFLRVMQYPKKIRNMRLFLFTSAKNAVLDYWNHHKRYTELKDYEPTAPPELKDLEKILDKVESPELRLFARGFQYDEIAKIQGISIDNVKVRIHRARA